MKKLLISLILLNMTTSFAQTMNSSTPLFDLQQERASHKDEPHDLGLRMRLGSQQREAEYSVTVGVDLSGKYSSDESNQTYFLVTGNLNLKSDFEKKGSLFPASHIKVRPLSIMELDGDIISELGLFPTDYIEDEGQSIKSDLRVRMLKAGVGMKKSYKANKDGPEIISAFIEAAIDAVGVQYLKHQLNGDRNEVDCIECNGHKRWVDGFDEIPGQPRFYLMGGQLAGGVKVLIREKNEITLNIIPLAASGHVAEGNHSLNYWSEISVNFKSDSGKRIGNIIFKKGTLLQTYRTKDEFNDILHYPGANDQNEQTYGSIGLEFVF